MKRKISLLLTFCLLVSSIFYIVPNYNITEAKTITESGIESNGRDIIISENNFFEESSNSENEILPTSDTSGNNAVSDDCYPVESDLISEDKAEEQASSIVDLALSSNDIELSADDIEIMPFTADYETAAGETADLSPYAGNFKIITDYIMANGNNDSESRKSVSYQKIVNEKKYEIRFEYYINPSNLQIIVSEYPTLSAKKYTSSYGYLFLLKNPTFDHINFHYDGDNNSAWGTIKDITTFTRNDHAKYEESYCGSVPPSKLLQYARESDQYWFLIIQDVLHDEFELNLESIGFIEYNKIHATSISLNKSELSLEVNGTSKLSANLLPVDTTDTVAWTSANPDVANVDSDGNVVAKSEGETVITAACKNVSTTCKVIVKDNRPQIKLTPNSLLLGVGETGTIEATLKNHNGDVASITWKSQDEKIATVSDKGIVKGVSVGNTKIIASLDGMTAECSVEVASKSEEVNYVVGQKIDVKKLFFKDVADISRYRVQLFHGGSASKYATVTSKGVLTLKKAGKIVLIPQKKISKKKYKDIENQFVFINIHAVPKLRFSKILTYEGQTINIYDCISEDLNKIGIQLYQDLKWNTSNANVASLDFDGNITAKGEGKAKITVFYSFIYADGALNTVKRTATLKVKYPKYTKNPVTVRMGKKKTITLKNVTVSMSPEWSISDNTIATISPKTNKGRNTGKAVVMGLNPGYTDAICIVDGKKYNCSIRVIY